jgi:hypothetical protein
MTWKGFTNDLTNSLKTDKGGFSFRKIMSGFVILMAIWLHYQFASIETVVSILVVDYTFIALLIGLVTASQIIELKKGEKSE